MSKDISQQIAEAAQVLADQGESPAKILRWLVYVFASSLCWGDRLKIVRSALHR